MKVKLMLDKKQYENKPSGKEIGSLQNRLINDGAEIEIKDLEESLTRGQTFKPSFLNGKGEENWLEEQLFALDFDHDTTITGTLDKCRELNILPCFGYTSFSHMVDKNDGFGKEERFRLVFCNYEVITDYDVAKKLQLTLMDIFKNCDIKCKNLSRLYFGGRQLIYDGYENRINHNELFEKYPIIIENKPTEKTSKPSTPKTDKNITEKKQPNNQVFNNNSDIYIKCIQKLDAKTLRNLVISRVQSEGVFGGLIEEDIYSYSISPLFLHPMSAIDNKGFKDIIQVKNRDEVYKIINNIDMKYLLGLDKNIGDNLFSCILPFHQDNHPSAHIFNSKDGTQLYKCFGCEFIGTILKLIEKIAKCNRPTAINFIKEVYNIELIQSDWQKKQIEIIDTNIDYLNSNEIEVDYPELYKRIKNKITRLNTLLNIAKTNIYDEDMSFEDKSVFFVSLTKIMDKFNIRSKDSANADINLFTLLSLIDKLPEENIPKEMLKKAKHMSALKGYKKIPNHYVIPSYSCETLEKSEEIAKTLKDNNFTMKGMSREYILRTFGIGEANRVYPLSKFENEQGTTKKSNNRTDDIVKVIFKVLDKKGYATEKQVTEVLRKKYGKTKTGVQIKRSIQEILDGYGLKRIRCNKEIKNQYGITQEGYPFIIVKNQ